MTSLSILDSRFSTPTGFPVSGTGLRSRTPASAARGIPRPRHPILHADSRGQCRLRASLVGPAAVAGRLRISQAKPLKSVELRAAIDERHEALAVPAGS